MKNILIVVFGLFFTIQNSSAQVFCNYSLGVLYPSNTWQYVSHSYLGYYSFNATANCNYTFTYCNATAPNCQYSGDPYLTISSSPTGGGIVVNNDFCSAGSEIQWTAPTSGTYYLNVGNCCSSGCGAITQRTFGFYSNCASTPPSPSSINASVLSVCQPNQPVVLNVGGVVGTAQWYSNSCGGTFVGSGSSITVYPSVSTTYFVRNLLGNVSSSCISIYIQVSTPPPPPSISGPALVACNNSGALTSSTGMNTVWYDSPVGGNIIGTGATLNLTSLINPKTVYAATAASISNASYYFLNTNNPQSWTVPTGVSQIIVDAIGAKGGNASNYTGGLGARVQAIIDVIPNETLNVFVGGVGSSSTATAAGGYNGGGAGTAGQWTATGGGGGGATDIRRGGSALSNRILVAAGGGGAGLSYGSGGGNGGNGGGEMGQAGFYGMAYDPTLCGTGGGIVGGIGGCNSGNGALGQGDAGRSGGGGGYFGGGGGQNGCGNGTQAGGAGGGSSFADSTCDQVIFTEGYNWGNGSLLINYTSIQGCLSQVSSFTVSVQGQAAPPQITPVSSISCNVPITLSSSAGPTTQWYSSLSGNPIHTGSTLTLPLLSQDTVIYASAANSSNNSHVFNFIGGNHHLWKVPSGVSEVTVDVKGAQGAQAQGSLGGAGGRVQAKIPVTEGQSIYFLVGGQGGSNQIGFNGGGGANLTSVQSGFGGGASDIRIGGLELMHRKVVAGGGGGAGYWYGNSNGGAGGGLIGASGLCSGVVGLYGGQGGTQVAGGQNGFGTSSGTLGIGGGVYSTSGGGGGGGYFGGAGGVQNSGSCYGGGGGGSSYTAPGITNVTHTQGYQVGNGTIGISYTQSGCLSYSAYAIQLGSTSSITDTACASFTINGTTYSASGSYVQLLTAANGCDSTLNLHLTILDTNSVTLSQSGCDSLHINGIDYYVSGNYNQVLSNLNGCDSTVHLQLSIAPSYMMVDQILACESYTWINGQTYVSDTSGITLYLVSNAGCDSTISLDLDISIPNQDTLIINASAINSYQVGDSVFTASDTYLIHFYDVYGCDSLILLNLVIDDAHTSYAAEARLSVYPNPSRNGIFTVDAEDLITTVFVTDALGKKVNYSFYENQLLLEHAVDGWYFAHIQLLDKWYVIPLIRAE
jgi:hypothetical protein